jgi:hypothetical protein
VSDTIPRCGACGQENRPRDLSKGADGKTRCEVCHDEYLAVDYMLAPCTKCGKKRDVCCDEGYSRQPDGTYKYDEPYCRDCCPKVRHPDRMIP